MSSNRRPDSDSPQLASRRSFIQTAGLAAGAIGAGGIVPAFANDTPAKSPSETLVKTFHDSLSEEQRRLMCFAFDHKLRFDVDNNWHITKARVKDFTRDQQAMIKEIFMGLHSEEYAQRVYDQVQSDSGRAGFEGGSSVALFGEPGTGKFQFVLTGRHCTRRCDGDSVEGASFGGPIFYGHAAGGFREGPKHEGNAYWYQAERANEVYQMLDGKQRGIALLGESRGENGLETVTLTGRKKGLDGIRVGDLSHDQKDHVRKVLADLMAPFRQRDAEEAMRHVEAGGIDNLHLAFYKDENIGDDEVWDVWQLEGPNMISYFRGKPHVHAWLHIREPA
ncbi:DUF3500 domain-containing protein [Haloferula sp. A504]|uniref:DUF3500 domain-containing protein n=1 Tax=Haloferula sp. A504 TaxID=3373601 RepID=UPI0031C7169D|nr:DUF3500 domain-containing protein [Verrucomicrobiaceae bacterium E54]